MADAPLDKLMRLAHRQLTDLRMTIVVRPSIVLIRGAALSA